ncbi:UNVERIFIED_ORG: hypothetical protein BTE55_09765 [Rhizobium sophorae]
MGNDRLTSTDVLKIVPYVRAIRTASGSCSMPMARCPPSAVSAGPGYDRLSIGRFAPGDEARSAPCLFVSPHDIVGRPDQGAGAAKPLVAPAKKRLSACGRTFRFFPATTP